MTGEAGGKAHTDARGRNTDWRYQDREEGVRGAERRSEVQFVERVKNRAYA